MILCFIIKYQPSIKGEYPTKYLIPAVFTLISALWLINNFAISLWDQQVAEIIINWIKFILFIINLQTIRGVQLLEFLMFILAPLLINSSTISMCPFPQAVE